MPLTWTFKALVFSCGLRLAADPVERLAQGLKFMVGSELNAAGLPVQLQVKLGVLLQELYEMQLQQLQQHHQLQ